MSDEQDHEAVAPTKTKAPKPFNLSRLKSESQAEMEILDEDDEPVGWTWIIAGPSHPNTIAANERAVQDHLDKEEEKEFARLNNKKWKRPREKWAELQHRAAEITASRVLGWSPDTVELNGETLSFSQDSVIKVLLDPDIGAKISGQLTEFFRDQHSFKKRSGNN